MNADHVAVFSTLDLVRMLFGVLIVCGGRGQSASFSGPAGSGKIIRCCISAWGRCCMACGYSSTALPSMMHNSGTGFELLISLVFPSHCFCFLQRRWLPAGESGVLGRLECSLSSPPLALRGCFFSMIFEQVRASLTFHRHDRDSSLMIMLFVPFRSASRDQTVLRSAFLFFCCLCLHQPGGISR